MAEHAAVAEAGESTAGVLTVHAPADSQLDAALETLRRTRLQLARQILALPPEQFSAQWPDQLAPAYMQLLQSVVRAEVPGLDEAALAEELKLQARAGLGQAQGLSRLAAGMLYWYPDTLEHPFELPELPTVFLKPYLSDMVGDRQFFVNGGDVDRHAEHMRRFVRYLHENILAHQGNAFWQQAAEQFTALASFIPLYFTTGNLREIYRQRSEIIECALKGRGHRLAYTFAARPPARRRIKLGLYNRHFHPHSETYAALPAFEYLDREKFEIILLAESANGNAAEKYCESRAERLVVLPNTLDGQAARIRAENLDLLLIANNMTSRSSSAALLGCHRLARVQVTFGGSPVTSGMRHNDYFLSNRLLEAGAGAQAHYTETVIPFTGSICYRMPEAFPPPSFRAERAGLGIPPEAVVFASAANFYKITPELRRAWIGILKAVPGSVLALCPFGPFWHNAYPESLFRRVFRRELARAGVAGERLIVLGLQGTWNVREFLKIADVYLDSFPYGGATSLMDSLSAGLPHVVLEGTSLRTMLGSALLRLAGLEDQVARSVDEYHELAIRFGRDAQLRQAARARITANPEGLRKLTDTQAFAAQLAPVLEKLVADWKPAARVTAQGEPGARELSPAQTVVRKGPAHTGPNAPCPCGSGKKYKKCCQARDY